MDTIEKTALGKVVDFIEPYVGILFPGCIVGCANTHQQFIYAAGTQDRTVKMHELDVFDISGITQTIQNVFTLKKFGLGGLGRKINEILPIEGDYIDLINIRHLLILGLEYGNSYKSLSEMTSQSEIDYRLEKADLISPPSTTYRNTNITSMVLSKFLIKKFGGDLANLLKQGLLLPLGMVNTSFDPKQYVSLSSIVPTEKGLDRGIVQDESARIYPESIGSAGLFSTAEDLLKFGQSFLGENTYLPIDVIRTMSVSQFPNQEKTFGLGMGLYHTKECDLQNEDGSPVVVLKKNGFSGVHFCVLPENDFVFVVFGNICYPHRPSQTKRDQFTKFYKELLRILYEGRKELLK